MERLDRLGWAAALTFAAYGLRVGIRVSDPVLLPRLTAELPPGSRRVPLPVVDRLYSVVGGGPGPTPGVRRYHLLYENAGRAVRTMRFEEVQEGLAELLGRYVAEHARTRLFVHAGVVGWQGRAIVLPGRTRSGKSTLVAALVRAGATYYSDEFAVFDERGIVHPYARPIRLRRDGSSEPLVVSAQQLGGPVGREGLTVGLVALLRYRHQAAWRPRRLSPAAAALQVLGHTVAARSAPRLALAVLQRATPGALAISGSRGEADETAAHLLELAAKAGSANSSP